MVSKNFDEGTLGRKSGTFERTSTGTARARKIRAVPVLGAKRPGQKYWRPYISGLSCMAALHDFRQRSALYLARRFEQNLAIKWR